MWMCWRPRLPQENETPYARESQFDASARARQLTGCKTSSGRGATCKQRSKPMVATTWTKWAIAGLIAALAVLVVANGTLIAQTPTPSNASNRARGEMEMDMASPAAGAAPMDEMRRLMEQCLAMMQQCLAMMQQMTGGDMSGMMASPAAGAAPMDEMRQMMEQCMAMMQQMMDMMGGMATPTTTPRP
jgi:hypothetical protein